jgi:hypothetical protein
VNTGTRNTRLRAACSWRIHGVHVEVHHNVGGWWASSIDIPGFGMVADTLEELRERVHDSISVYRRGTVHSLDAGARVPRDGDFADHRHGGP